MIRNPAFSASINEEMKEKLINEVLRSEDFFFCEKELQFNQTITTLKYAKSFEILSKNATPGWKILPFNSGSVGQEETYFTMNDFMKNPTMKVANNDFKDFFVDYMKYFLFLEYRQIARLPNKNELLFANFKRSQGKLLHSLKSDDSYANFLVEVSLILNTLEISYKTTYICEETGILIDIAIPENRQAIVFYDESQSVSYLDKDKKKRLPNNLVLAKARILEKIGKWQVQVMNFEAWMKEFNTITIRDEYFQFCKGKILEKSTI